MDTPLVSVIIPLYNAEKYLAETLDSVLYQTYKNWECIIVDDGSTDESLSIVQKFIQFDERIKLYRQVNSGASAARNKGFAESKGEYIQYLDADDIILPGKIDLMVKKYEFQNEKVLYYSNMELGSFENIYFKLPLRFKLDTGSDINFEYCYKRYARNFGITPACFLFPRDALFNVNWDTDLGPSEDWDYFLQIIENGYTFRFLPEVLVLYRNTPNSYSKKSSKSFRSAYNVLTKWVLIKNKYFLTFSFRMSLVLKKSIFSFLTGKTNHIHFPGFKKYVLSMRHYFFIGLIYPILLYLLGLEFIKILFKKVSNIFNN